MRAGDLDRRITIRREEHIPDGGGGHSIEWTDLATVWARVVQEGGREYLARDQITAERRTVFTIRYRSDIAETDRIAYDGWTYNIHELRELGRRVGLEIHATARGDQ